MTDAQPDPRVMDIYKLAVEMADRVSTRRATANAFFVTVNTALVAFIGLRKEAPPDVLLLTAVCAAGVVVAWCWWLLLRVYRRLNGAKFTVITRIEADHLPVKPFTDEWAELTRGLPNPGRITKIGSVFRELGAVERLVPMVFGVIYVMLLVGQLT